MRFASSVQTGWVTPLVAVASVTAHASHFPGPAKAVHLAIDETVILLTLSLHRY